MRSNVSTMVKTYKFLWLPTGFGKSETLPFVFNYKHGDGRTGVVVA